MKGNVKEIKGSWTVRGIETDAPRPFPEIDRRQLEVKEEK